MKRIDQILEISHNAYLASVSDHKRREKEVCDIAWKTLQRGKLSAMDYIQICTANNQLPF